jgi:Protein of unknown function (DUF2905)
VVLIAEGLLWPLLQKLGLGRLPGDIVIERENFRFYFPIVTSLITSVVLSPTAATGRSRSSSAAAAG